MDRIYLTKDDQNLTKSQLAKKYGITESSAYRAKQRADDNSYGYFTRNYHKGGKTATDVQQKKVIEILGMKEIRISQWLSVPAWKYEEMRNGKSKLQARDWTAFRTECVDLRNEIRVFVTTPTENNLTTLLENPKIKKSKFCEGVDAAYLRLRKGKDVSTEELQQLKLKAAALYNRLNVG